jgi:hypothetical protein
MLPGSAIGRRTRSFVHGVLSLLASLPILASTAGAQVGDYSWVTYPGWIPSDRVVPRVVAAHPYDSVSRTYTYRYTIANDATAQQAILEFGTVLNIGLPRPPWLASIPVTQPAAPTGWEALGASHADDYSMPGVVFFATLPDQYGESPNGPAAAQIPPGQSLSGFSHASPYPPGWVRGYVRGFAPIPFLPEDFDHATLEVPRDTTDSQRIWVLGPRRYTDVWHYGVGNFGEPAGANGFLVWMNLYPDQWMEATSIVPIALKFSMDGQTVYRETFSVTLNGVNVTSSFQPGPDDGAHLVAVFTVGSSPLRAGSNTIITRVEGLLPGTTTRAADEDTMSFTVQP